MITISQAIRSLVPNAPAHYIDDGKITGWDVAEVKTGVTQPTQSEIDAEVIRLQAIYDSQAYARSRKTEYPSIEECVHAILDDDLDALQVKRQAVKDKYPK